MGGFKRKKTGDWNNVLKWTFGLIRIEMKMSNRVIENEDNNLHESKTQTN